SFVTSDTVGGGVPARLGTSLAASDLDVGQGKGGGLFDRLQGETGADVEEVDRGDEPLVHRIVPLDVRYDDAHQVVHVAAHAVDLGHLGDVLYGPHELLVPGLAVIGGLQSHEYGRADVELAGVQQRDDSLDHALILQALNAAPAGRLRQADAFSDVGCGERTVFLQLLQDSSIELVHDTQVSQIAGFEQQCCASRRLFPADRNPVAGCRR